MINWVGPAGLECTFPTLLCFEVGRRSHRGKSRRGPGGWNPEREGMAGHEAGGQGKVGTLAGH